MLNEIQERDLIWLAGLMEGEGSFYPGSAAHSSNLPWVSLKMTDKDVIDYVGKLWGVKTVVEPRKPVQHKDAYVIRARGRRAVLLMWMLRPYMFERRRARIDEVLATAVFHRTGPRANPEVIAKAADLKAQAEALIIRP